MVDYKTVPQKHWFMEMFGMLDNVSGTSKINGKYIKWNIADRNISSNSSNDIYHIEGVEVPGQNNVTNSWKMEAYNKQEYARFNLTFYDYETYKEYYNFIFGN
jgi:hypothetical protein